MKYLENQIQKLEELKKGIKKNRKMWNGLPVPDVEIHIKELKKMNMEIEDIKKTLSEKLSEARKLRDEKREEIIKIEKRAIGVHADNEEKLADYSMDVKRLYRVVV